MGASAASPNPGGGGGVVIPLSNNFLQYHFIAAQRTCVTNESVRDTVFKSKFLQNLYMQEKKGAHVHKRTCMRVVPVA